MKTGRGRPFLRLRRGSGECSTSVESSSQASQDVRLPATSAVGASTRRRVNQTATQHDSDDFDHENYYDERSKNISENIASVKPELEAYCDGSWWDVEILRKKRDKYYVHYQKFPDQTNQWVPWHHLRMRCRTSYLKDCSSIVPGIDVCTMTQHPHSDQTLPAWYDARIIDAERHPHTAKRCKCLFTIALYTIPDTLSSDVNERHRLPSSIKKVALKKMSIMREARSMSFQQVIAASLPGVTNPLTIWAKDGLRWYSSLDVTSSSRDRSTSIESSRVAGGSSGPSLSLSYLEEHAPIRVPKMMPFDSFLEEIGLPSLNPDDRGKAVVSIPGSKAEPIILDVTDVDINHLDRYSGEESDGRARPPEKMDDVWDNVNPISSSESLGNPDEGKGDVVLSDLESLRPAFGKPSNPISLTLGVSSSSTYVETASLVPDPVQTVPLAPRSVQTIPLAKPSEDPDMDFAEYLDQYIDVAVTKTHEPATSSGNSDWDGFWDYREQNTPGNGCAEENIAEKHGTKRNIYGKHWTKRRAAGNSVIKLSTTGNGGVKRSTAGREGAKRLRLNPLLKGGANPESSFPRFDTKEILRRKLSPRAILNQAEHLRSKEQATALPSNYLERVTATLDKSPVNGGKVLDKFANTDLEYADELIELLGGERCPESVRTILDRSKEVSKRGRPPQVLKDKRSKKVSKEIAAVPKFAAKEPAKEITYAQLFESVEPVQLNIPSEEKDPTEGSGLLPSWNPLIESEDPASLQEMEDDPLADVWEDLRVAQECEKEGNYEVNEAAEEFSELFGICEHPDGTKHPEHGALIFNQEDGEVCEVCGIVVNDIKDMWARDNAKRLPSAKEKNYDSDEDYYGCDENALSFWDSDDENHKQENTIEGDSNFERIPDLAKCMQKHQKEGFQFLWRCLDGQDSNGATCFEKGGCVLSHAPGTGKTFLIISFLQSYMKKYPHTRPIIVAPKIMLQPWEKEFKKWNADIPVHNFNQADFEQGRAILQQHEEAGDVQLNQGGRSHFKKKLIYREAMLWQWMKTSSVLLISYQMFSVINKPSPSDTTSFRIRKTLLERPHIMILDEGHTVRNKQAQVLKQMYAVRTPLRVLLSGTLFQNNFEELFTCLNVVRSGFVKTFAKAAGLKFDIQQGIEGPQNDTESEQLATERKEKALKIAEAQTRKFFIEEIGNKIDRGQMTKSSPDSLTQGLEQLRRLTSPFVHHYAGGVLRNLPPLRDFAILFQPTALQEKMMQRLNTELKSKTMLERECLFSMVCIHPTLFSQHNVGKVLTDLLSPEEMKQVASNRDPAVGVKTRFVMNLLKQLRYGQEKVLIFCQNLDPLLLLEEMLGKQFGWIREREILQIDGKVQSDERQSIIERFNDPKGRIRVLLASTKACGEGVTLIGASRVVFMDVLWNPAVIRQAIHRAFRIGQNKVVYVYRLVMSGTFEVGKYRRAVWKDWKSQAIFFEKGKKSQQGIWEIKKQFSKDVILNELCRLDAALGQPAFKKIFRHDGLFDDDYEADPDGRGTDAIDWLRGTEEAESFDLESDFSGDDGDTDDFDGLEEDA